MRRIVQCAGIFALVLLGFPAASSSANHQIFTDATGDQTQAYAFTPDITTVEVTSTDQADLTFRISIIEQAAVFYVGNTLAVWVDADSNASTGATTLGGVEYALFGFFLSSGNVYELCNYRSDGTRSCETLSTNGVSRAKTGTNSHVITFSVRASHAVSRFYVFGTHQTAGNPSAPLYQDRAPNSGWYEFDLKADLDQDGVVGFADECPNARGGRFDTDKDGCPPVLPVPEWTYVPGAFGSYAFYSKFRVRNANNGITVTARFPGLTAHRKGTGLLRAVSGRRFRVGSSVTVIYSNREYFGRYRVARISADGYLRQTRTGCTLPGRVTFVGCPSP